MNEELQTAGPYGIAGVIVFAAIKLAPWLVRIYNVLIAIWEQREVKLEQDHRRDRKRRRAESEQPPNRGASKMPSVDAAPMFVDEESTDMVDVREVVRKRSPGLRAPRKGTHHDGEEG